MCDPTDSGALAAIEARAAQAAVDGRSDECIDLLREAREGWRALGRQPQLLRAYAALGAQYLAAARLDEAESAVRTAIQQARVFGDPVELGRALLLLGRILERTPRADRALLAFTEAAGCLRGRDAAAHEQAGAGLRGLGRVPGGAR